MGYESEQYYARRNAEEEGWSIGMCIFGLIVLAIVAVFCYNFWFTDSDRGEIKDLYHDMFPPSETKQVDE